MTGYVNPLILDAAISKVAEGDVFSACEGEPTTYGEATTRKSMGGKALCQGACAFTGPADASPDGRKLTVDPLVELDVTDTGWWDWGAIVDSVTDTLLVSVAKDSADILSADSVSNVITISGDWVGEILPGGDVTIRRSTENDGHYLVESVSIIGSDTSLTLSGTTSLVGDTGDGECVVSAIKLSQNDKLTTQSFDVKLLPEVS